MLPWVVKGYRWRNDGVVHLESRARVRIVLVRSAGLSVDAGRAVPSVERLLSRVWDWSPAAIVCDSYRVAELHKAVQGRARVIERARSHGEATSNIQSLRSLLLDTKAGATEPSRDLLAAAWAQTNLVISPDGLTKVVKVGSTAKS